MDKADGAPAIPTEDGLPTPRRYWAVLTIWLGIAMAVLDGAVANVALPTIALDLNTDPGSSIWIVNAYQLAITIALLPVASLGDKLGHRRVYLVGLAIFTIGSLACAMSQSLIQLTAARVFQGLGAAVLMSISSALLRHIFPTDRFGRGIGLNAVVISVAAAIGPTVASGVLAVASWQWLFAINLPFGIAAMMLGLRVLPHTVGSRAPLDFISAGLNALAFGGLILGAERVASDGPAAGLPVIAAGIAAAVILVRRERHSATPLLPFDLMRIPIFRLSILASIVCFSAQMLAFVALPFHFQGVLGRTAVETGLLMTPWPLAVGVAAPFAGALSDRYPAGLLGGLGLGAFAVGLGLLASLPDMPTDADILWRMAVCGIGFGLFQAPNNRTIIAAAPRRRAGIAGGTMATARLLGQTTGAVVMAVLFHAAILHPTTTGLVVAAALAACAALLSLWRLRV